MFSFSLAARPFKHACFVGSTEVAMDVLQISVTKRMNPLIPVATSEVDVQLNKIANDGAARSTHDLFTQPWDTSVKERG